MPNRPVTDHHHGVRAAMVLMFACAVASLMAAALAYMTRRDQLRTTARISLTEQGQPASDQAVDTYVNATITSLVMAGLILASVWIALATLSGKAPRPARIPVTTVAALHIHDLANR